MFEFSRRRVPGIARRVALGAAFALLALVVAILVTGCPPPPPKGATVVILLDPEVGVCPVIPTLHQADQIPIVWHNNDDQAHTVKFVPGRWPFVGPQHDIVVQPHKSSEGLRLDPSKKARFDYTVVPPVGPSKPPDGPAVVVDG